MALVSDFSELLLLERQRMVWKRMTNLNNLSLEKVSRLEEASKFIKLIRYENMRYLQNVIS